MEKRKDYSITACMKYSRISTLPHNMPITYTPINIIKYEYKKDSLVTSALRNYSSSTNKAYMMVFNIRMLIQTNLSVY
jgi:hypothetical protein